MTAEVIPFPRRSQPPGRSPVDLLCRDTPLDVLGPRLINMLDLVHEIGDLCGQLGLIEPQKSPARPRQRRKSRMDESLDPKAAA
ncbi:MAG: hypothetical protein ACREFN_11980 [Acetobacteraceae bacterium]